MKLGENVTAEVADGKLLIEIDLNHRGGVSASGKTIRVASTCGNKPIQGDIVLGLNVYIPNK
jgi:hypothetical protein